VLTIDGTAKRYKANFKGLSAENEQKLKHKSTGCILPISVGRHYHEEGRLEATLKLVSLCFKECLILVADTLQRYSLAIVSPEQSGESLYKLASENGFAWINRNIEAIKKHLTIPFKIQRWDDWLWHKNFQFYYEKVTGLYEMDLKYKSAVNDIANQFCTAVKNRTPFSVHDDVYALSVRYLLEESAATCLWTYLPYEFQVYPINGNEVLALARDKVLGADISSRLEQLIVVFHKVVYKRSEQGSYERECV
jgi:hypothetical protein